MRTLIWVGLITILTGCGGSQRSYLGEIIVRPDAQGVVEGFPEESLTIVRDASGNGYVYGFATGLNAATFADNFTSSDTANFAVTGLLPDGELSDAPLTGAARFDGAYELVKVDGYASTSNHNQWVVTEHQGDIGFDVNFRTGAIAGAADGDIVVIRAEGYERIEGDSGPFSNGVSGGTATFDGIDGYFEGMIGGDGAALIMSGTNNDSFFAGGILASVPEPIGDF